MPYSTLHAMMCCHTNKSNLVLLPFLFSVLCPYIQLFFSVVYILECYVTFSLSCFFETLVSRCFRDLFIILLLLLLLLLLLFHERTEMHEIVWPTTKKKKKKKEKERNTWTGHLDFHCVTFASSNYEFTPPRTSRSYITMCKKNRNK